MKTYLIINLTITFMVLTACTNNNPTVSKNSGEYIKVNPLNENATIKSSKDEKSKIQIKEIVTLYLQLKNDLTKDLSSEAAGSGKALEAKFAGIDISVLSDAEQKLFEDMAADAEENAEHIAESSGNIEHQREHFDLLSRDMYDLIKEYGSGLALYKDFCPMYNDGKGAFWISEIKEIQNPYFGKTMPTCGTVQEELN